jgi:hypothetical protein
MISGSEAAFRELAISGTTLGEIKVRDSDVRVAAGPVLHGLDMKGSRHLLIPIKGSDAPVEDRKSTGVQIQVRSLIEDGATRRFLDVVCLKPDLSQLYSTVVDEMLMGIQERPDSADAACHDVLERWRELLESGRQKLLLVERQAALIAELEWVTLIGNHDPETAIASWRGPLMGRQDFVSGLTALEVKATMAREGRFTEIHGDRQLEPPDGGILYLSFHRYERVPVGGNSIPDQIDLALNSGIDRQRLLALVAQAGYDSRDSEAYRAFRFSRTEFRVYRVDASFPKLTPASFAGGVTPERVGEVRYVIDLEGEPPVPLSESAIEGLLESLGRG